MRRRVEDMENVLLEQFDNRSEVSSIVSVAPRYVRCKMSCYFTPSVSVACYALTLKELRAWDSPRG